MAKNQPDIFIIPFARDQKTLTLNVDTVQHPIVSSDAFWQHFTATFPTATIALFTRREDSYDNYIQLTDAAYTYGLITSRNQIFLRNHLLKNLSKEQSDTYWKSTGFFVLDDLVSSNDANQEKRIIETHWVQASVEVEKDYLQFLALVTDLDREFAIVAKRNIIESILRNYQLDHR